MKEQEDLTAWELYTLRGSNKFASLIDALYNLGAGMCKHIPGILNVSDTVKCKLLVKKGETLILAEPKDNWPLEAKVINGVVVLRINLDECILQRARDTGRKKDELQRR